MTASYSLKVAAGRTFYIPAGTSSPRCKNITRSVVLLTDGRQISQSWHSFLWPVFQTGVSRDSGSSRLNLAHETRFDHHLRGCRPPLGVLISLCASLSPRIHFGQRVSSSTALVGGGPRSQTNFLL